MSTEHGQNNVKQDQLLEIYKIHVEQANNISNRRTTVNRFYQVFLSGLIVIFLAFLQNKNDKSVNFLDAVSIEWVMLILGGLGMWLAFTWGISIHSYILQNTRKYEALKDLEGDLEYQFLQEEWKYLGLGKNKTYKSLAVAEFFTPFTFFASFLVLFVFGVSQWQGEDPRTVKLFVIGLLYFLAFLVLFWVYRVFTTDGISLYKEIRRKIGKREK